MRSSPRWVLVSAAALTTWLVLLALYLLWEGSRDFGYEFTDLSRKVALVIGVLFGIPTILLLALLFVRRIARVAGLAAVAWMGLSAYVWMPVPVLGVGAALVALLVLGAMVRDWRVRTGPAQDRWPG
jgi:hypothetical protein